MPDAVRLDHVAPFVDQDVKGQSRVLDVTPDRVARLREEPDDLNAAGAELIQVFRKLAKLAAAVRSPGAAVKHEQETAVRQQIRQCAHPSLLIG
jgi:hypothetical protein